MAAEVATVALEIADEIAKIKKTEEYTFSYT